MVKKLHACIYCGSLDSPSRDHIPPKTLFVRPRPPNLITVPSCIACNKGFALDDEYLRTALIARAETADHPATAPLLDSVSRSLSRPQARGLADLIDASIKDIDLYTPSGLYLGQQSVFIVDEQRLRRCIERIGRAIFYHESGVAIPARIRVQADLRFEMDVDRQQTVERYLAGRPVRRFGINEFQYSWMSASDNPLSSVSRLVFFGVTQFVCITAPARAGIDVAAI